MIKTDEYKADHTAIVDGKVYAIRNAATGKYITALDSQSTNGANIIQDVLDKTSAQSFIAKKHADGSFSFVNKETGKALDIMNAGGSVKSGCNVQLYTYNKSSVQRFTVYKAENGFFKLCCENVPSISLSVYGNYNGDNGKSPTSFGNVYMNSATDDDLYQMWEFVPLN